MSGIFKVRKLEDLSGDYTRPTAASGAPKGVKGFVPRLINASNREWWSSQGLVPIMKGSGLIENEDNFMVTAEGVLRAGAMEIWGESEEHYKNRALDLKAQHHQRMQVVQQREELHDAVRASGGHAHLEENKFGGVKFESGIVGEEEGGAQDANTLLTRINELETRLAQAESGTGKRGGRGRAAVTDEGVPSFLTEQ